MELKITKEKVLEAASKCSAAKQTLETLFPECFEKEVNVKIGDRFKIYMYTYILAKSKINEVVLINIKDGDRLVNAINVNDSDNITLEEWEKIAGLNWKEILKTKNT